MTEKNYRKKLEDVTRVAKDLMPNLPYHNFKNHAADVYETVATLAYLEGVNGEDNFLLRTAALLHDVILVSGAPDNEEKSAEFARNYLPQIGYTTEQAYKVGNLILPTKLPQNPKNHLEKIICDADVDNLGRADFFEKGEKIREELGLPKNRQWHKQQLQFLKNHKYYTGTARSLRNSGKRENIRKLKKLIREEKC